MSSNKENKEQSIRLNKALASAGICSRRAADELIGSGKVFVNGYIAVNGQKINPLIDNISVNGKPVNIALQNEEKFIYIVQNKPIHVVSTAFDPEGRRTVLDILPSSLKEQQNDNRLYPVGRLDYFSQGLLLLTNDGDLTFKLTHPSYHVPRVYKVVVRENVDEGQLAIMRCGMTLEEGERLAPVNVEIVKKEAAKTTLKMTLHQGLNRQIRRMCRDLGLTILRLCRVQIGPLKLGELQIGQSRPLSDFELAELKEMLEKSAKNKYFANKK